MVRYQTVAGSVVAGETGGGTASQAGRIKRSVQGPLPVCGNRGEEISTVGEQTGSRKTGKEQCLWGPRS